MLPRVIIKCIFSFYILICIPLLSHAAEVPAINHPGARVILREEMIPINNRFPTLSSIRLGLGDYIDWVCQEFCVNHFSACRVIVFHEFRHTLIHQQLVANERPVWYPAP